MNKLVLFAVIALFSLPASAQASAGFTKVANVSTLTYVDSTCPDQSTCYYQVLTLDSSGFEASPATCSLTTLCVGGNEAVAGMPTSGTHTVTVGWVASTTTGVTYNVYRHIGPFAATGLNVIVN